MTIMTKLAGAHGARQNCHSELTRLLDSSSVGNVSAKASHPI
jgi:hypothetical protein